MLSHIQVAATEIERVRGDVPVMYDREDTFFSFVERRPVEVVNSRDMRAPLELRPGGNFGHFDADGGDLGRGDGPVFDKALIPTTNLKFAVEWTAKAQWTTDDKRKAVIDTFRHLMANSMAEYRRHIDTLAIGSAGDGVLGTVESTSNSGGVDTVVLTNTNGARLLRYGQPINVYSSTLATNRTAGAEKEITYLDGATRTIKVPTVTGLVAGDKIVVSGVSATPPVSLLGVLYHHNGAVTGSWLGLDRALVPEVRANRVNAAGALALPHARMALNKIGERLGMGKGRRLTAWMHPAQLQAYEDLANLSVVINKSPSSREGLDLYWGDNITIAGIPIKTHWAWPKDRIVFIANDSWYLPDMHPVGFYEVGGTRIWPIRGASGGIATSSIFYYVGSFNFALANPAAVAYIDGLTVPAGF